MKKFLESQVKAINYNDFSYTEEFHDPNGTSIGEIRNFVASAHARGASEELLSVVVTNTKKTDGGYKVATTEEYHIDYKESGEKYKKYQSQYQIKNINGELKVHALLETKEIDSKDL
ncbi:hypothetical protein CN373_23960 [Bacillus cereus]|uniref:TcaA protein NTF2-like domain-containing protein n=2 Tax=Bacillus TaxID=1386 RepID=A0AA44TES7_BACCE|nr:MULTISPECIES: hypothetical protein [Bacillus cereus group]PFA14402.1 hypothetical protein CN373_23960 [Bacillus cereus]PFN00610.1 hypothetical protein COJ55_24780 [Bacillus cereus]PFO80092.1 hypothetical protein COJ77_18650 [Bacillus cereus]PFR27700.1 hypothetical protein COK19_09745 [Bacillus cereus]PFR98623.1 hypothetical protein COK38_18870 [Bacillus cereus]